MQLNTKTKAPRRLAFLSMQCQENANDTWFTNAIRTAVPGGAHSTEIQGDYGETSATGAVLSALGIFYNLISTPQPLDFMVFLSGAPCKMRHNDINYQIGAYLCVYTIFFKWNFASFFKVFIIKYLFNCWWASVGSLNKQI